MTNTMSNPAQACWIDGGLAQAPIFCWYHAPASVGLCRAAIVLCPPFAHDYMVSYQAMQSWARQLAQAGYAVLHPDLQHAGDSADIAGLWQADEQLDLIAIWQENIRRAAAFVRQKSGMQRLILAGLRLGASLAASVAASCQAQALILFAPVLQGRHYARELLMLKNSNQTGATGITEAELAGYYFGPALRKGLQQLNLLKLACPAPQIYLIPRDDLDGQEADLISHWHDASVVSLAFPGYAEMLTEDAHSSRVPQDLWSQITTQLQHQFELQAVMPTAMACEQSWQHNDFHEHLIEWQGLQGVLCLPRQQPTKAAIAELVVILNTGANHRVGTHRLSVFLARQLATAGHAVLRFDKAGLGYSRACLDGSTLQVFNDETQENIRITLDHFAKQFACQRFILTGLCSGAYFAFQAACEDPRITGVISMNQPTYHWQAGDSLEIRRNNAIKSSHHYRLALLQKTTWLRLLRGQIDLRKIARQMAKRMLKRLRTQGQLLSLKILNQPYFLSALARQARALDARACRLHLVLDAGDAGVDVMTEEFGRHAILLRFQSQATLTILPGADHTFTALWSQRELAELLKRLLSSAKN